MILISPKQIPDLSKGHPWTQVKTLTSFIIQRERGHVVRVEGKHFLPEDRVLELNGGFLCSYCTLSVPLLCTSHGLEFKVLKIKKEDDLCWILSLYAALL